MLSLGGERLPPPPQKKFWIITCTTIWVCYNYYCGFLLMYSSQDTQIITKIWSVLHCTTQDPSIKFHPNPFITFWVMLSTDRQTDKLTNATKNIGSFAKEVITSGRVLDGEILYTEILEVNLFAFTYRLFHEGFLSNLLFSLQFTRPVGKCRF